MSTQTDPNYTNARRKYYGEVTGFEVLNARLFLLSLGMGLALILSAGFNATEWWAAKSRGVVVLTRAADGTRRHWPSTTCSTRPARSASGR